MTTFPLIAIIAIAFTVLWLILFFKQTAKPMPSREDTTECDQEPEDPFDVEYDPEVEARNSYTMQVEDEILKRNGIL